MKTSDYKTTDTIDVSGIHPELQADLIKIAKEYKNCTDFAALIPLFSKSILSNKVEGDYYFRLADTYKATYFAWGINWQTNKAVNLPKELSMPRGLNNSFYFLPEQLEAGLDKINDWYVMTKGSIEGILKQKKIEKLQAELLGLTKVE
jgi:hypothetical protein